MERRVETIQQSQETSYEALASPIYSASWVDQDTRDCCFDFHEIAAPLSMNMNAEVDWRFSRLLAKAESLYPRRGRLFDVLNGVV